MSTYPSMKEETSGTLKRRVEQIFALSWLVVGVVVMISSSDLEYMDEYGPGAGFGPFFVGIFMICLGIALFAQLTFKREMKDNLLLPNKKAAWQMFFIMLAFFVFVFLADKIGFLISIGCLFFFLLMFVERRGWKFSLGVSITSLFLFWVVFELLLQMNLPLGYDFLPWVR